MSLRKHRLVLQRYSAPTIVDGVVSQGVSETLTILASVQPISEADKMRLDEDLRSQNEVLRVYTATLLKTASAGAQADTLTYNGNLYEVRSVENWSNGIKPHYKAVISR